MKIAGFIVGGYIAMVGVTHGYIATLPSDCRGATYYDCMVEHKARSVFSPAIWPLFWISHLTQEALK